MEWLLKMAATPIIGAILNPILNAYVTTQKQKLDAQGSHEARSEELALKTLELDAKEAQVNAQVIVAEQGNWVTRSIRPLFGLAAAILTWKILVWDLAFGEWTQGSTDKLSSQAYWLLTTIVIAYMGGRTAETIAAKIAGAQK